MEKATRFVLAVFLIVMTTSCTQGQMVTACTSCTGGSGTSQVTQNPASSTNPVITSRTTGANDNSGDASTSGSPIPPSSTPVFTPTVSGRPAASPGNTPSPGETPSTSEPSPSGTNSPGATTLKAGTCCLFWSCGPMLLSVISTLIWNA
ncbi:uncharacterized protein LOC133635633 [Entelurus aequoreus]|uniref:uncharacterized protein LOC133635633 n=1 Tax=Entelurus aequoreus TaxID=161455 RepID=UPI002B1E75D0|nr:uncharacterized protein LOC133635633 [Entelurus aequoreus]